MLLTTEISIKIQGPNINYYKSLGYNNIKVKDSIKIPIIQLPKTSHEKVLIKCDKCGDEKISHYFAYNKYIIKYDDDKYLCNKCNDSNRKKTLLKKYGSDSLIKIEEFNIKRKKTILDRFGFDHPCKSDEIKQKIIDTNLERYGVKYTSQVKEVRDNINATNLERYGNINSLINDKTLEKTFNTMINKYGVKYTSQNKELSKNITFTLRKTNTKKILETHKDIIEADYENSNFIVTCDQKKEHNFTINTHLYYQRKIYNIPICTICNPINSNISGAEIMLLNFIEENYNKEIIINNRNIIKPYELDIYLPDLKLAFEYNGLYWHSEKFKDYNYHLNKTELCEENGIRLINIWEDDWIQKNDIIKSIILNNISKKSLYKLKEYEIKEIYNSNIVKKFLNINHIEGFVKSNIKIGLFDHNNELISLMIFNKNKNYYKLLRYCNKLNDNTNNEVLLFHYFKLKYQPKEVISEINRNLKDDLLYEFGFKIIKNTQQNCFYIKNFIRYNNINSKENLLRIYDSGNIIYKYIS